ncbi:hypothetical protein LC613_22340 [Nostoc sphaeroides CHAB 2801]|uniref:hypothetical protein n=1 Tax=Nostoc sphaeroides TaxID=446679 RepID=UPI001E542773|nr:hypothetical protein [Nostoc sphaeroides]MCC5630590.1 hypothetical protein [Nostoc sphaeroides CHAB 2801]
MTVHEFSVNSQQSTTLMWNNLFFGVPLVQRYRFLSNTVQLRRIVGWVEERNPTFTVVCWVTLKFNSTYAVYGF